jgi:hypothetical protein
MVKWISLGLTIIVLIVSGIWTFESRYQKISEAKEMKTSIVEKVTKVKAEVSKETLETFKDVQQSLQSMQKYNDINILESLRDRKYLLEKQFKVYPNNELLEEKIEIIQRQIEKLENKLYE